MIFFFNGAHKNASHFQLMIVTEALKLAGISFEIIGDIVFDEKRLFQSGPKEGKKILDRLDDPDKIYICKAHWGTKVERNLLLSYSQIKIFLIWRDLRDVLVSSYHFHNKREGNIYKDFEDYYQRKGRSIAFFQKIYYHNWHRVTDPKVYQVLFKKLKDDFHMYAGDMLKFANVPSVDLDLLKKEVDIARLREKYSDNKALLFRKGIVGDHESTILPGILQDISWIDGLSRRQLYWHLFLHNPKVTLKQQYEFPGQSQLLWFFRKVRAGK